MTFRLQIFCNRKVMFYYCEELYSYNNKNERRKVMFEEISLDNLKVYVTINQYTKSLKE